MLPVVEDKLLTRYLLGTLTEAEQAQVEEQLFADADCYDRLCALKEELTDQCVLGELPRKEQQVFARRFLRTADGREDALFARALDVAVQEQTRRPVIAQTTVTLSWREKLTAYFQFPVWHIAITAAAILLAVGLAFFFTEARRMRQQLESTNQQLASAQTKAEQSARTEAELAEQLRRAQARNEELDQRSRAAEQERDQARKELERAATRPASGSMVNTLLSLILVPGAGRGDAKVDELTVTPQTNNVQLRLLLSAGEDYPAYRAEILTKQDELIQTQIQLRSRRTKDGSAVQLTIPARRLPEGSYQVRLTGVRPDQTTKFLNHYDFKITRGK
jgi:hypothetical protein